MLTVFSAKTTSAYGNFGLLWFWAAQQQLPPFSPLAAVLLPSPVGYDVVTASLLPQAGMLQVQLNSCWLICEVSIPGLEKQNALVEGLYIKYRECYSKELHQSPGHSLTAPSDCPSSDLRLLIAPPSLYNKYWGQAAAVPELHHRKDWSTIPWRISSVIVR